MSQLLITGATGQLGSQIVSELTAKYPIAQLSVLARSSEKGHPFSAYLYLNCLLRIRN